MGTEYIRRWESGALAHAVSDPFGMGPLPWLRGSEHYFDDTGHVVPWYVDHVDAPGASTFPLPRAHDGGPGGPGDADDLLHARWGAYAAARRSGHRSGPRMADDVHRQIKGFASAGAVAPGDAIDFRVTVNPPQEFSVDIYRIGHYAGEGASKITTTPRLAGIVQPAPLAADRTVSCHHWWLSRLQVPTYWQVGVYVAVLTTIRDGFRSHIPFTVRDQDPADLLLVLPDVTWQAYNLYPEDGRFGASLYQAWDAEGRLLGEEDAATTLSFDRPYASAGLPLHVGHAYDFIRWAERYAYDVAYANTRDLHAGRVDPTRYRGLVFPGQDEYWSVPMRRSVEQARDAGTSLVFLSANTIYWQLELGPSPMGPDRLLSCRKRRGPGRPTLWRELGSPEQQLIGNPVRGPGPRAGPAGRPQRRPLAVGGDGRRRGRRAARPGRRRGRPVLPAHQPAAAHPPDPARALPVRGQRRRSPRHQETSLYRAPSGALVFASGTFAWSPALDRPGHVDARVQRATANLLDRICKRD